MNQQNLNLAAGDVIIQQAKSGVWHTIKILQIDAFPDGSTTAHCLSYNDASSKPSVSALAALGVRR